MREEEFVACFNDVSRISSGGTEENHKSLSRDITDLVNCNRSARHKRYSLIEPTLRHFFE